MQSFLALVTPIGAQGLGDLRPDQSLPGQPVYPSQGPIYGGGHPSQGLPGFPPHPSTGPIYGGGHPSQGLPPSPGHPSQGLPGQGGGGSTLPVWNPIYGWFLMKIKEQKPGVDNELPDEEEAQPK